MGSQVGSVVEEIRRVVPFARVGCELDEAVDLALDGARLGRLHEMILGVGPLSTAEWLPTTHDAEPPAFDSALLALIQENELGESVRQDSLTAANEAMRALRSVREVPALRIGPDNLLPAARGAFVFACRRATAEAVIGRHGFWTQVLRWYGRGRWPGAYLSKPGSQPTLVVF